MQYNKKKESTKTVNLAGGTAYKMTDKMAFVSLLLTSFVQEQFYSTASEQEKKMQYLLLSVDKKFAAKASIYARNEYGMRTISHIVAGEIASLVKGETWTKNYFEKVVRRPDDITEILSYYTENYGKTIPNSLKKGFGKAFLNFDAYQLSKYSGKHNAISLVDALRLVHPRPETDESKELLRKFVYNELAPAKTWETGLTQAGQKADSEEQKKELKTAVWKELLEENRLGYFALLRNVRNIMTQAPEMIDLMCERLVDRKAIKKSLVMPFRFQTAFNEVRSMKVGKTANVLESIAKAVDISLENVPVYDGRTLIAVDCSGSMTGRPIEIASLFAAALYKSNDSDIMLFAEDARYENFLRSDSALTISHEIKKRANYGGTNFSSIFQKANSQYDRIIILSDMQSWMSPDGYHSPRNFITNKTLNEYKGMHGACPKVYSFDLAGHGTLQFPQQDVYMVAGFSDKVFSMMKMLEADKDALIDEIEKIVI